MTMLTHRRVLLHLDCDDKNDQWPAQPCPRQYRKLGVHHDRGPFCILFREKRKNDHVSDCAWLHFPFRLRQTKGSGQFSLAGWSGKN